MTTLQQQDIYLVIVRRHNLALAGEVCTGDMSMTGRAAGLVVLHVFWRQFAHLQPVALMCVGWLRVALGTLPARSGPSRWHPGASKLCCIAGRH